MMLRRYLTFSLRTAFVVMTASAVWTATIVNRARQQREAVEAIEALGGIVLYDYHFESYEDLPFNTDGSYNTDGIKSGPGWLQRIIGDDYFQNVEQVELYLPEGKVLVAIPYLKLLRHLKTLYVGQGISSETEARLITAQPNCQITAYKLDGRNHVIGERQIWPASTAAQRIDK